MSQTSVHRAGPVLFASLLMAALALGLVAGDTLVLLAFVLVGMGNHATLEAANAPVRFAVLAGPLLRRLREDPQMCVGDNEPYSGRHPAGYTIGAHAESRGLPHVSIEVRQDLLMTSADVSRWAALLASALRPIISAV